MRERLLSITLWTGRKKNNPKGGYEKRFGTHYRKNPTNSMRERVLKHGG